MKHCKIVTCHVLMCKPSFQFQIPTTIKTREQFYIDPNRNNHSNINIAFSYRILYRPHWMCIYMLHVSDICQDEICFYFLDFKMPTVTMEITKCMQLMTSIFRRFPLPWQLQVVDDIIACDGNFSYSSNGFSHLTWPQQLSKRVSQLNRTIYNAFYLHILIQMRSIGLIANVTTLHKKANDVEGTGSVLHSVYCLCMRPIEW